MTLAPKVLGGVAALALAAGGVVAGTQLASSSSSSTVTVAPAPPGCNDWPGVQLSTGECQAAGVIRYVALYNLQGASQFCKWRAANPGEWSRIKGYASSSARPSAIVTWFGASIVNDLEAYFVTGAPPFDDPSTATVESIAPNTAPNACKGQTLAPPVVAGVTPGQTDATVTIKP